MLAPEILHVLEFDQALVAHIAIGVGGPVKNFKGQQDRLIEKRKSTWSTTFHPLLDEKRLVNFGPLTKKL